jgi:hypothetical protein
MFPMLIGISGSVFTAWIILSGMLELGSAGGREEKSVKQKNDGLAATHRDSIDIKSEAVMVMWMLGFLVLILIFGFWVAIAAFTVFFMPIFGREKWKLVITYTMGIWLAIYLVFAVGMKVPLYSGALELSLWRGM